MNTKKFAQDARSILLKGVTSKLLYWGFESDGSVLEKPTEISGGYLFRGEVYDDSTLIKRWESLMAAVKTKGYEQVVEEAAYTWFNRIMAIRILAKNGYDSAQLEFANEEQQVPVILQRARRGTHSFLNETATGRLKKVIADYNSENEAFAILLIGYCHAHPLINAVFGGIDDYTELLLPDNMFSEDGFLYSLNTTDAISEEDYKEVELIGWLYQFYISEKKDEVFKSFKKNKKAEAKDIPAATQIFTPNWIVKYMVENTVGKLWLDLKSDSPLKSEMKYLVESEDTVYGDPIIKEIADLKLLDPACGSGHILVEGFELLYQMYLEEYYPPDEAVETIIEKNLFGLDIDRRAMQLAQFAVLLKAAKYHRGILSPRSDGKMLLPNIYAMPEPRAFSRQEVLDFLGKEGAIVEPVLSKSLKLMQQAKNLGSIMQFDLGDWDFRDTKIIEFLIKEDWVKNEFYQNVAALSEALENFTTNLKKNWGSWTFSKAKIVKSLEKDASVLTQLVEEALAVSKIASSCGFHSAELLKLEKVKQLLNLKEEEQKQQIRWISQLMRNHKMNSETLETLYETLDLEAQSFRERVIRDAENSSRIRAELLVILPYTFSLRRSLKHTPEQFTLDLIESKWKKFNEQKLSFHEVALFPALKEFIPVLTSIIQKYEVVVTNPPYLRLNHMNDNLKNYCSTEFPFTKSDLFAVFMRSCLKSNLLGGLMGMINQHSWMFLSSYENLRKDILSKCDIKSLIHLGARTFQELKGEVVQSTAFILRNKRTNFNGIYYRLVDLKNLNQKEQGFLAKENLFLNSNQDSFNKLPGSPIAYWINENERDSYLNGSLFSSVSSPKKGIDTGENEVFLRFWFEVDFSKGAFLKFDTEKKWFPYNKGGFYRKWYGNREVSINWENSGKDIKERLNWKKKKPTIRNKEFHFKEGFTWTTVSSNKFSCRYVPDGCMFDNGGCTLFSEKNPKYLAGMLNSPVAQRYFDFLAPTLNFQPGNIGNMLYSPSVEHLEFIESLVDQLILISKRDWDSSELSWDFQKSRLFDIKKTNLEDSYFSWEKDVEKDFFETLKLEENLNQIFFKIYRINLDSSSQVQLKDITLLQEELDRKGLKSLDGGYIDKGEKITVLPIKRDVVMQKFISYSMGTFMGRYRLDRSGLHIAHPDAEAKDIEPYSFNGKQVEIDDDAIIPLMGSNGNFADDAVNRFKSFLDIIWGEDTRTENLNFLQECLNKDVEDYFIKNFWADHCKRYKNKPIYWLFSSPKGAFQVLVYMHRMNAFTVEKIRSNYLMPHLKHLRAQINRLSAEEATLSSTDARLLDKLRKQLMECEAYDMQIKNVADQQIVFDLDDGVTVNHAKFDAVVKKIK